MMLGARTAAWSGGKKLPYLRLVEWIGSDSNQYITIPVSFSVNDYVSVECDFLADGKSGTVGDLFAFEKNANDFRVGYFSDRVLASTICGESGGGGIGYSVLQRGKISLSTEGKIGFDGIFKSLSRQITRPLSGKMYMFGKGSGVSFSGRFYGCKIIVNEDVICDAIPVLDLSGRPAMYDEVSGQLFYNQGTGEFTWGELET